MCDYSLQMVKSRPAQVGDKLITYNFGHGTTGFKAVDDVENGPAATAVCVLPGTELAFDELPRATGIFMVSTNVSEELTARFRQTDTEYQLIHHDALEFADGKTVKLSYLYEGQRATVLQLPAVPRTEAEAKEQARVPVVA